jgi:UDP-glucose 4-epimerase
MNRHVFLGGAGFIGYHLADFYSRSGDFEILIIDNLVRGENDQYFQELCSRKNVIYLNMDLCDAEKLSQVLVQGDIVFNLAALNGTQNFYNQPLNVLRNTAVSAIAIVEACGKVRVQKYIYFGSSESYAGAVQLGLATIPTPENVPFVFPDPTNLRWSYGLSKSIGEVASYALHKESKVDFLICRVHNIYGPRMGLEHVIPDLITKFLNGKLEVYGGDETRSFMFVADLVKIVDQIYLKPEYGNIVVNIGNSSETKISDLAEMLRQKLGIAGNLEFQASISGSVARRVPDLTLMNAHTQLIPTNLNDGLDATISYYKDFPPMRMPRTIT